MSLINQMLQDLEKRRASDHERDVLPLHVRVLPEPQQSRMTWWIAGAGALVVTAALARQLTHRAGLPRAAAVSDANTPLQAPAAPALLPRVDVPSEIIAPAAPAAVAPQVVASPQPLSQPASPIPSATVI